MVFGKEQDANATHHLAPILIERDPTSIREDSNMTNLKDQVAEHQYNVDSKRVAEEIIRKLRLIKWARQELVSGPGRTPGSKLPGL